MSNSRSDRSPRVVDLTRTAMIAVGIPLIPQGVWSALIITNLRLLPAVPWAV
jgi:hypothetical protein